MAEPFIRAAQFARAYRLLQGERKIHTQRREQVRDCLEAIFWMSRSSAQWCLLPTSYGAWNSVDKRFARWDELGVWERLCHQVADDPDFQRVLIAATVVGAHARAGGVPEKTAGRRRKGWGARAAASARRSICSWMRWGIR